MKNHVTVTIGGQQYAILAAEGEEYVRKVAAYVDGKLKETMEGGKMKKSLDPAVHLLIFMKELLRLCPTFLQFRHSGRDTAELNVFLMPLSLMQLLLFLI